MYSYTAVSSVKKYTFTGTKELLRWSLSCKFYIAPGQKGAVKIRKKRRKEEALFKGLRLDIVMAQT